MPRFFDRITGILYLVRANSRGRGAPGQLSNNRLLLLPNQPRQNGRHLVQGARYRNYISLQTGQWLCGPYDLNHPSNVDLRPVAAIRNI